MTTKTAYQILGLLPGASLYEIKKKYRELMMQVHPDTSIHNRKTYGFNAQEINAAYSVLKEKLSSDTGTKNSTGKNRSPRKKNASWNAPINENAYSEREILQYAEGHNGSVFGNFCIAKGRYMWTAEEDFPLFLLSIYQCSKQLLDKADASVHRKSPSLVRHQIQTELAYLLAQQFIAGTDLLKELAKEEKPDKDGHRIFYISSMLERLKKPASLKTGETIYPSRIIRHKLYLKNQAGQELGYLSFTDDRLYYIVIPLFEQKRVQVRIQAAEKQPEKKSRANYLNLHLWLKLYSENTNQMPENLNLQIEQLLKEYAFS